jgi:flagellar hook assembly protein FlgD
MDLQTADVTGASYAKTDADPAVFTVPGNASVKAGGAGLFADADLTPGDGGLPPASLPADARVRVLTSVQNANGVRALQVEPHDGSTGGWMAATDLVPRDSTKPQVWEISTGGSAFSPNGDGRQDTLTLKASLSEASWWRVRYWQGETVVWSGSGEGTAVSATWSGVADGLPVADGSYRWTLETRDGWLNEGALKEGTVKVDTVAPELAGLSIAADTSVTFSPNGDAKADTVAIGWQTSEAGAVDAAMRNAGGTWVRTMSSATAAGAGSTTWDGRSNAGAYVADGLYTVRLTPRDAAGNLGSPQYRSVAVYGALANVRSSVTWFYPQDKDRLATHTVLSFTLARPATVTWQVKNRAGEVVFTRFDNVALGAGTHSFKWYGKDQAGAIVPAGFYTSVVQATDGTVGISQAASMELNAFAFRVTDSTPARGQTITVTGITAEPLSGYVYLHVTQPGLPTWYVRMAKATSTSYKATIKLRSSSTGTMALRISAKDVDGRFQATYLKLALH